MKSLVSILFMLVITYNLNFASGDIYILNNRDEPDNQVIHIKEVYKAIDTFNLKVDIF